MKTDREKLISWMQDALTEWSKNHEVVGDSAIRYMADRLIKNGVVIPVRCKDCIHGAGATDKKRYCLRLLHDRRCDRRRLCKYGTTEEVKRDYDGWQAQMLNTFLGGKV